jgi:hypothetical protein
MPLRKALIEAPLSSGLNQEADARSLVIDGAVQMTNCVRTKNGAIRKRVGCKRLSSTLKKGIISRSESGSVRGVNYGASPLHFNGYTFSQYSDGEGVWQLIDSAPEAVALDHIPVIATGPNAGLFQGADMAYAANQNYYVAIATNNVVVNPATGLFTGSINTSVIDASSAAVVQPSLTIDTYGGVNQIPGFPKIIVCGNFAIAAWQRLAGATPGLYLSRLDLTNVNAGWSTITLFDNTIIASFLCQYDITPVVGDTTRFVLAYVTSAGGNNKCVTVSVSTFGVVHTFTSAGVGAIASIGVLATLNEQCWVAYVRTGGAFFVPEAWSFNDASFAQTTPVNWGSYPPGGYAQMGIARVSSTSSVVFYTIFDSSPAPHLTSLYGQQVSVIAGVATAVGAAKRTPGVTLGSKPVVINQAVGIRCYAMVLVVSALQGTQSLVCFDWFGLSSAAAATDAPARLVATVAPRLAKAAGSANVVSPDLIGLTFPCQLVATSATTIATLTFVNTSLTRIGMFIQPFDLASQLRYFGNTLAGNYTLGLSAGTPFTYDGQTPSEMGFLWYPEAITLTTGAGSMNGVFSYIATYEWTDAGGNIHRSAASPPIGVACVNNNVTLTLPTLGITWRQRPQAASFFGNAVSQNAAPKVKICVYATVAGGTSYYLIGSRENDTSASSITFFDSTGGVPGRELLYTTGGILDNFLPPSARICVTHKNRFFLSGCDDPTVIWPSKAFTSGEVPGFNEQMNLFASGAVTALASMDEKLIVFVRRGTDQLGIEYIVGEGPFDTGASNDWTNPPQPVPANVGAVDQRSIVVTELGCMFLSPTGAPNGGGGIFLLSRDLQVHYISGNVEDLIDANPVCTGALAHPSQGRVYFEMAPNDSPTVGTGARLVYDYITQCWSVDSHFSFDLGGDFAAARTTWVAGGRGDTLTGTANMPLVYWADITGAIYRENSGVLVANAYVDSHPLVPATRWITASFTSAWFKPALSGFARFWRAQIQSSRLDPAQLSVSFQFDYAGASYYTETNSWTDTQIATFDRIPQVDIEHLVGNQKAKAIQVTLTDTQPIGGYTTGQGFSWASISLEVGVDDQGRNQNLPPGQRG